jgi:signal transduction protein with GAF and PtsI domain
MDDSETGYISEFCNLCGDLIAAGDLDETLRVLTEGCTRSLKVKACSIRLLDERGERLEMRAAHGLSQEYLKKGPVEIEKNPLDQRILRGEILSILDVTKEPLFQYPEEAKKEGLCSFLSVPLKMKEKPVGVLRIYTSQPHQFNKNEVAIANTLAVQGAIAIGKAKLQQRMRTLMEIARSINSTLDLSEVLDLIVKSAARTMGYKAASLRLLDREGETLKIRATYGLSKKYLEKGPVRVSESVLDQECLAGKPINISNVDAEPRVRYREEIKREGISSVLYVPLLVKNKAIGLLRVYSSLPHWFSQDEVDFLLALANQVATAIENARLFEHLKRDYEDLTQSVWKWYDWGSRPPKL